MLEKREDVRGRALLVGLNCPGLAGFDNSDTETMDELDELVQTAGGVPVLRAMQNRHTPDPHTFIGEGKCEELAELIKKMETEKKVIEQTLLKYLGDNDSTEAENAQFSVRWTSYMRSSIDTESLKREAPDVYERYKKTSSANKLTIKAAA